MHQESNHSARYFAGNSPPLLRVYRMFSYVPFYAVSIQETKDPPKT
jgi:hypothetical protein